MFDFTRFRPERITSSIPLMALSAMLLTVVIMYCDITALQKTILACVMIGAVIATIVLAKQPAGKTTAQHSDIADVPLRALIDGSQLPMYILGNDLRIKYCNGRMLES